ncbi:MAG: tRNA (adenosine(37)-N6)-threonylcarbamoyltransferase complex dimerization subunit type 1 TsaB [Burkholderiales bacterium]
MSSGKILALDCSTEYCSVALLVDGELTDRAELAGQRHSELVLPMVDAVLAGGALALRELDAIAFGAGPGSFTGLRIACGVAQGLAFGASRPVVPVPTLLALAHATDARRVLAILDARMGEVYLAAYDRTNGPWQTCIAPCVCKPDAAPQLPGGDWKGVGNGFAVHGDKLRQRYVDKLTDVDAKAYPHARHIAWLADEEWRAGRGVAASVALPLYIRDKVAFTESERRAAT